MDNEEKRSVACLILWPTSTELPTGNTLSVIAKHARAQEKAVLKHTGHHRQNKSEGKITYNSCCEKYKKAKK